MADDNGKPGRLSPEEERLWKNAIQGAKQLPKNKPKTENSPPPQAPPPPQNHPRPSAPERAHPVSLPFLAPGDVTAVDGNTANRLRRGKYPIDRSLDLHGMTREAAHQHLQREMLSTWQCGGRCLLVVTGKGNVLKGEGGVIRESLPSWLNNETLRPYVLAYCPAAPQDGGSGAFYVLLRRERGR